jgi:uncharacterized protein RhaS with RHS repeats
MSPDDGSDQDPSNPQSFNLYSYVRNNPVGNTDPDGHSVNVCDNYGNCNVVSNDEYTAAQQSDPYNSAPTLDAVGMSGNGAGQFSPVAIFGDSGIVGSATYVSDGPLDYYANLNGYNTLATASATAGSLKGIAAWYGASGAIAACIVGCPAAGTAALTMGRSLYYAAAGLLPAVPSAIEKLQKLGISIPEANELIESPSTQRLVDNANSGNINYIADVGGKLIRITTDPSGQRIISAGMMRANQVTNGIQSGRFTP